MYYLLAGTLGFLLCGAWFGTQLWLKQLFSRWGREGLILFAPLLAACPPMLLLCWRGLYGPQGPGPAAALALAALRGHRAGRLRDQVSGRQEGLDRWAAGAGAAVARRPRWWKSRSVGCCRSS